MGIESVHVLKAVKRVNKIRKISGWIGWYHGVLTALLLGMYDNKYWITSFMLVLMLSFMFNDCMNTATFFSSN